MPAASKPDSFLTELHKMFERTKAKGSISLTTSRSKIESFDCFFFFGDRPYRLLLDLDLRAKLLFLSCASETNPKTTTDFSQQTSKAGIRESPTR